MNCKDCIFRNSHPEDILFCFALSLFIQDANKPMCGGEFFKAHADENLETDRFKELTDGLEGLRDA